MADNKDALDIALKVVGSAVAFAGLIWTLYHGIKTFGNYANDKKHQQISNFILLFADSNPIKRLSSVSGIISYIDSLFVEIFLLTAKEKEVNIKKMLYEALMKNSEKSHSQAIQLNSFYTQLLLEDADRHPCDVYLSTKQIRVLESHYTNIRIEREIAEKAKVNFSVLSNEMSNQEEIADYILLSSKIVANGLQARGIKAIGGLFLISASLYSVRLADRSFVSCVLRYNIFRHSTMHRVCFESCSISDSNNFLDVSFFKVQFSLNEMKDTVFRHATFRKSSFFSNTINSNIFSSSTHSETRFAENIFDLCKLKGCEIEHSSFEENKFTRCQLQGARFENCTFVKTTIWSSDLNSSNFFRCSLSNVKFGGACLKNVCFTGCEFHDVDFAGADLGNAVFSKCKFYANTSFWKARGCETVSFIDCLGKVDSVI